MPQDDEEELAADGDAAVEGEEELIEEDMGCLRCEYNLRGLKTVGQCPECGASIGKTVAFARQRILCPACLQPNHPSLSLCVHCTAPLNGAAAASLYWKMTPVAGRRIPPHPDDEPSSPHAGGMVFFGTAGVVLLGVLAIKALRWMTEPGPPLETDGMAVVRHIFVGCILVVVAVGLSMMIVLPARLYARGRRTYLVKKREWDAKHPEEIGGATEPEEDPE